MFNIVGDIHGHADELYRCCRNWVSRLKMKFGPTLLEHFLFSLFK
jgi:hypothetical protein